MAHRVSTDGCKTKWKQRTSKKRQHSDSDDSGDDAIDSMLKEMEKSMPRQRQDVHRDRPNDAGIVHHATHSRKKRSSDAAGTSSRQSADQTRQTENQQMLYDDFDTSKEIAVSLRTSQHFCSISGKKMDSEPSKITEKSLQIPFGEKTIEAILSQPVGDDIEPGVNICGIILTHGAGGDMNLPQLAQIANHLAEKGRLMCARFTCRALNLKYRIKAYKAVVEYFIQHEGWSHCVIGGRSMGSRAAVSTANEFQSLDDKNPIKGVICLSYPLHPPKDVSKLRNDILHEAKLPILFISGTEDVQCEQQLMGDTLDKMECSVTMHWLKGGNHGLHVKGHVDSVTNDWLCQVLCDWCKKTITNDHPSEVLLNVRHSELDGNETVGEVKTPKGSRKRVARHRQGGQSKKMK